MIRRLAATLAIVALPMGLAAAQDTAESLRGPVVEKCKVDMAAGLPGDAAAADKFCGCMVDGIITSFGDDALPMMKVLQAGVKETDLPGIAALLGISEDDAEAFVGRAEVKFRPLNEKCAAELGGEP